MGNVKELSREDWKQTVLDSKKPVLVDFWAPWCGPCRMQGPAVEELAGVMGDKAVVAKLNTDDNPDIAGEYNIQGIPTLLVFKNGEVAQEFVGLTPLEVLKDALAKA